MAYTKDRRNEPIPAIWNTGDNTTPSLQTTFPQKCRAFRNWLFPPPPFAPPPEWTEYSPSQRWEWPDLSLEELQRACSNTHVKATSPGPDGMSQAIIAKAYEAIPDTFYQIYPTVLNLGYHPTPWRQATGVVLKKQGKPDYTQPKAYRVISLLNCLGKVSERILAKRIGHLAETGPLLHPSQMGGRKKKSAIDTVFLLRNTVDRHRRKQKKTSTLFLDVKGAYDHVAKNQLLAIMKKLELPTSLIALLLPGQTPQTVH